MRDLRAGWWHWQDRRRDHDDGDGRAKTVLAACPHDCPDTCSMLVTVENGRVVRCAAIPSIPSPRAPVRQGQSLRGTRAPPRARALSSSAGGPRAPAGSSASAGTRRWTRSHRAGTADPAEHGPTAILPYSYLGTEGILNGMNVGDPFFNKLGATITERTFCDSGACTGVHDDGRPHAGHRSRKLRALALHHPVGLQHHQHQPHHWPFIAEAQKRGAKIVVVDPVRTRTARAGRLAHPDQPGHGRRALPWR